MDLLPDEEDINTDQEEVTPSQKPIKKKGQKYLVHIKVADIPYLQGVGILLNAR